jgi:hypothetical protein
MSMMLWQRLFRALLIFFFGTFTIEDASLAQLIQQSEADKIVERWSNMTVDLTASKNPTSSAKCTIFVFTNPEIGQTRNFSNGLLQSVIDQSRFGTRDYIYQRVLPKTMSIFDMETMMGTIFSRRIGLGDDINYVLIKDIESFEKMRSTNIGAPNNKCISFLKIINLSLVSSSAFSLRTKFIYIDNRGNIFEKSSEMGLQPYRQYIADDSYVLRDLRDSLQGCIMEFGNWVAKRNKKGSIKLKKIT